MIKLYLREERKTRHSLKGEREREAQVYDDFQKEIECERSAAEGNEILKTYENFHFGSFSTINSTLSLTHILYRQLYVSVQFEFPSFRGCMCFHVQYYMKMPHSVRVFVIKRGTLWSGTRAFITKTFSLKGEKEREVKCNIKSV